MRELGKHGDFQAVSRSISETVRDIWPKLLYWSLVGSRISAIDLCQSQRPWTAIMHSGIQIMCLMERTMEIWKKIKPYNQQQKCSPRNPLSDGIRFMGIFIGVPCSERASNDSGVTKNMILNNFSHDVFGTFKDKASISIKWHEVPYWLSNNSKMSHPDRPCRVGKIFWHYISLVSLVEQRRS